MWSVLHHLRTLSAKRRGSWEDWPGSGKAIDLSWKLRAVHKAVEAVDRPRTAARSLTARRWADQFNESSYHFIRSSGAWCADFSDLLARLEFAPSNTAPLSQGLDCSDSRLDRLGWLWLLLR